jgi:HK97 family phage prohead protease
MTTMTESLVRSWSVLTVKAASDEGDERILRGIASTPSTDRMGDVIDPRGAQFALPLPLLAQHDSHSPIGLVRTARVTDEGIEIEAALPKDSGLGYVEKAWLQIKSGLVRGLSIGFRSLKSEPIKGSHGVRFTAWEWLELSAVTIPANAEASILTVKQFDLAPLDPAPMGDPVRRALDLRERAAVALEKSAVTLTRRL